MPGRDRKGAFALDCLLLAVLTIWIIGPLFRLKYSNRWESIESTFIADARFLDQHWPHPLWQPLWYTGTRFDYIYPPALRYGTAAVTRLLRVIPAKAYHIYTALFYVVSITGVYVLVRVAAQSRGAAWLAALASLLLSPSFLFLPALRHDSWLRHPLRLGVLTRYGEGPHVCALAVLPIALAFAFRALVRRRPAALAGAAAASALVVSTNFYGATALALFFPVLVWSLWITHRDNAILLRAAAIAALSYGLTAFWLVPSYIRITVANLQYVAQSGTVSSLAIFLAIIAAWLLLTTRFAAGKPERAWPVFVFGSLLLFGVNVLGNAWFGFRVTGEPLRLVLELDLVLILAAVELVRALWRSGTWPRVAAALAVAACFATAIPYVRHHAEFFPRDEHPEQRIEYRIQDWISHHLPGARPMVTGSVRFWYDAWHDLPHLDGGSDQGVINAVVIPAQTEILQGSKVADSLPWLLALGVDAVVVHDATSQERYHDFQTPAKFAGVLPILYDTHQGDVIYRVPRRFPGIARVINGANLHGVMDAPAYAALVEQGPDSPATVAWQSTDSFQVHARLDPGQLILVQEAFDPNWRARCRGRELDVHKDPMGFMTVAPPPGEQDIHFEFPLPRENAIGRAITLVTLVLLAAICGRQAYAALR